MSISESAKIAIPKIKADSLKFWWDDILDDLKNNSVNSFRLCKSVGKPRNGPIFEEMSRHRLLYRNQIRIMKILHLFRFQMTCMMLYSRKIQMAFGNAGKINVAIKVKIQ